MNLADLSIKRPVFITCIFAIILIVGGICFRTIGIDLFPNMTFPVVLITTIYPGAGPEEIEMEVSKTIEDEISTLAGIKSVRSSSRESLSIVVAEFTAETDIKYATQQIRDRVSYIRSLLPQDIKEPLIRNIDPDELPIAVVGVGADLSEAELYDLCDEQVKNRLEQVENVGLVEIYGARKREIHVELDRSALKRHEVSASAVSMRIAASGKNIPAGKVVEGGRETVIRSTAEFRSLKDIGETIVSFAGNDVPVQVKDIGRVVDSLEEEKSRAFIDGKRSIFLYVYKQSGTNTVAVFDGIVRALEKLNRELADAPGHPKISVVRDGAKPIRLNVNDVKESISLGIILTIVVVYFFLGSLRSTFITGIALPNSLIGAFILIAAAGFSINVITLLALSLAVGLLIDDAIVVRENIFRHMEMGKTAEKAASDGAKEVMLAVIATTLCIIAVFGPVSFIKGMIGKFLMEFGLTVCFAMMISLFDSLTMGPMLSAYAGGITEREKENIIYRYTLGALLLGFDRFQDWLSRKYERILRTGVRWPTTIILASILLFGYSIFVLKKIPVNFMSNSDLGEFIIDIDAPAGVSLDRMAELAGKVEAKIRKHKEIATIVTTVGNANGQSNLANFYVKLVGSRERPMKTSDFKEVVRKDLVEFSSMNPKISDSAGLSGMGSQRSFTINIIGSDLSEVKKYADRLAARLRSSPDLKEVDTSYREGKPELDIALNGRKAFQYGISSAAVGNELRILVEGSTPAVFRDHGREYDIRVRLQESQRVLKGRFEETYIPNINQTLVKLSNVGSVVETVGPATIDRRDRGRSIVVSADLNIKGGGLSKAIRETEEFLTRGEGKLPSGMRYRFSGQAESMGDVITGILTATILGITFIYAVLASLYESFITPFTIMLVFPLAICGAFLALYFSHSNLDMMAMIGCVMLIGLATKNSILLVDYANQLVEKGENRIEAIISAGRVRLRPILMTSIALIMGMLPIAIGLSEVSSQRKAMGIAVIGGVISSTLLTLIVVPAVYSHIDHFRVWSLGLVRRIFGVKRTDNSAT
ncbi:MAG: efflux RND transporter permease subunit [Oligoflexales bacterium]|nr:efflux RND transporter permease subunit [Oligoflexales bacterium]